MQYPSSFLLSSTQKIIKDTSFTKSFYLYDYDAIKQRAQNIGKYNSEFFQARYALKANPKKEILDIMKQQSIFLDACSEEEVIYAIQYGFNPNHIQLSAQQSPSSWKVFSDQGVSCIATSLNQLEDFCKIHPNGYVGVRINPGQGSGQFQQINTGGETSAFGIRHEYIHKIFDITKQYDTRITTLHIHIGSGSDTEVRLQTFRYCLDLCKYFPDLQILNMGGGYKVARMVDEKETDLDSIITSALLEVKKYSLEKNTILKLEIEPGSFFVATHGYIVCLVDDIVDTGIHGYRFVKTTTGMDMILRPALYYAQHPIYHYSLTSQQWSTTGEHEYSFIGHCCESTDLLTPNKDGSIGKRGFNQQIQRGDIIVIGGCGAYCESMRCRGYNGFSL